ncbi:HNH endonuclease signature motif containing protein [Aspergillus alliaceus]|uniref:HNH endonuclease signature motif containing protein n=1 Tax=Petromyces alliaceus TaxID=209559 RepID=UPI0012A3D291|nr:uncharacterized protein BDW43DRAFT_315015 [Aspergillus alliaceus]KAB8229436.1 hypothetical protein BDW43DRAFT_315015 [Aspergillus alliaceus]
MSTTEVPLNMALREAKQRVDTAMMNKLLIEELEDASKVGLIKELSRTLNMDLDSGVRACLWFADVERLKALVQKAREDEDSEALILLRGDLVTAMLQTCKLLPRYPTPTPDVVALTNPSVIEGVPRKPQRKRKRQESVSEPSEASTSDGQNQTLLQTAAASGPDTLLGPPRLGKAKKLCRERDQNTCVVTANGITAEVAHIYTHCLNPLDSQNQDRNRIFWSVLKLFWSKAMVESWKSAVLGPMGTEACQNMLCLSPTVHRRWQKAHFALKPVDKSDNGKEMTVQFFYLLRGKYAQQTKLETRPDETCHLTPGIMYNEKAGAAIYSGQKLVIKTADPQRHPLPSFDLLQMQWILTRIVAMSGAADDIEPSDRFSGGNMDWFLGMCDEEKEEEEEEEEEENSEDEEDEEKIEEEVEKGKETDGEKQGVRSSIVPRVGENQPVHSIP